MRKTLEQCNSIAASEWISCVEKPELQPHEATYGSNLHVKWKCHFCGNEWTSTIKSRSRGSNCRKCSQRKKITIPEFLLLHYLKKIFNNIRHREIVNGHEVDLLIPDYRIVIEYDGAYYHKDRAQSDQEKSAVILGLGYEVVRIRSESLPVLRSVKGLHIVQGTLDKESDRKKTDLLMRDLLHTLGGIIHFSNQEKGKINALWMLDFNIENQTVKVNIPYREVKNNLLELHPYIAEEWYYPKNGRLRPEYFTCGSKEEVYWKCKFCGHIWKAGIAYRVQGNGCPVEGGKVVTPEYNFQVLHPELAKEWSVSNATAPDQVHPYCNTSFMWTCSLCGYDWPAKVSERVRGRNCPVEAGKAVTSTRNLAYCSPELVEEWSDRNPRGPETYAPKSNAKVWWKCKLCGWEWQACIDHRVRGEGCPVEAGKVINETNCLATTHPEIAAQMTENNKITADHITAGNSTVQVEWRCEKCHHIWRTTVASRVSGRGCAACAHKIPTTEYSLSALFPELVQIWSAKNKLSASDYLPFSNKEVYFKCSCNKNHPDFPRIIRNMVRSYINRGLNELCPYCQGKRVCDENSLAIRYPDVARKWDSVKNGEVTPYDVTPGSNKKFYWIVKGNSVRRPVIQMTRYAKK